MELLTKTIEIPAWLYWATIAYLAIEAGVKLWAIGRRK